MITRASSHGSGLALQAYDIHNVVVRCDASAVFVMVPCAMSAVTGSSAVTSFSQVGDTRLDQDGSLCRPARSSRPRPCMLACGRPAALAAFTPARSSLVLIVAGLDCQERHALILHLWLRLGPREGGFGLVLLRLLPGNLSDMRASSRLHLRLCSSVSAKRRPR